MQITKQDFDRYEAVRQSGATNMFNVEAVIDLADLTREQCMEIMQRYGELFAKFRSKNGNN